MELLNLLFNIITAMGVLFVILSVILAAITFYQKIKIPGNSIKDKAILALCILYPLLLLYMLIFKSVLLMDLISMIFIGITVVSTQLTKYEDRKARRRWWTQ